MSSVGTRVQSTSERWVLAWVDRYTRDVPPSVASDRRDELLSDLWEQAHTENGGTTARVTTAISILSRAIRGVPADLSWRQAQLAGRPPQSFRMRFVNGLVPAGVVLATVVGLMVTSMGIFALGRVAIVVARHQFPPSDLTVMSTAFGTLGLACGLVLMIRSRTRWIGAIWRAASASIVLYFGGLALVTISATAQWFANRLLEYPMSPIGQPAVIATITAVCFFYVSLAIAWIPQDEASR